MIKNFRLLLVTTALATASACQTTRPDVRGEYLLRDLGGLIVSNSISWQQLPKKSGSHKVLLEYSLLLKKTETGSEITLKPETAILKLAGTEIPAIRGLIGGRATGEVKLEAGRETRAEYVFEIDANASNRLHLKDTIGTIEIPYLHEKKQGLISVRYVFLAEDFN